MEKIELPLKVAKTFCSEYQNIGEYDAFEYLRKANLAQEFLDWDRECLLYSLIAMNTILNDYCWEGSLDEIDKDLRPAFDEAWIADLESKYADTKKTFLDSFSNLNFEEDTEG